MQRGCQVNGERGAEGEIKNEGRRDRSEKSSPVRGKCHRETGDTQSGSQDCEKAGPAMLVEIPETREREMYEAFAKDHKGEFL